MLTVIDVKPEGTVLCPCSVTPDELLRMLSLPKVTHVQVSGAGQRWVREIAKKSGNLYSTKPVAEKLVLLKRITSPRPDMSLEELDKHIAWHADMVSTLVKERPLLLQHDKRTLDVLARQKRKFVEQEVERDGGGRFTSSEDQEGADVTSERPSGVPVEQKPSPVDRLLGGRQASTWDDELAALDAALEETGLDIADKDSPLVAED